MPQPFDAKAPPHWTTPLGPYNWEKGLTRFSMSRLALRPIVMKSASTGSRVPQPEWTRKRVHRLKQTLGFSSGSVKGLGFRVRV
eukprot:scaffold5203_cov22-Tisochrysis_lutea.AAC.9